MLLLPQPHRAQAQQQQVVVLQIGALHPRLLGACRFHRWLHWVCSSREGTLRSQQKQLRPALGQWTAALGRAGCVAACLATLWEQLGVSARGMALWLQLAAKHQVKQGCYDC
jgi:hypothetical protein